MRLSLRSVEGLKTITARAYSGVAVVILEFDVNFQKQKALADVRARVDETRSLLPAKPIATVNEVNIALQPVISAALSGDVPDRTLLKLARDLKDDLKTIPSVLDVDIDGERKEMLEIVIDPAKLKLRHHATGDVQRRFEQQPAHCGQPDRHRPWQLRR